MTGAPHRLAENERLSFNGSKLDAIGFVLTPEEAQALIARDPRNRDVLFPYLNGEDLNSRPDQSPSRRVINFHDWPIERAMEYPDCFRIVEEKVKPQRMRQNDAGGKLYWWRFLRTRPELYSTIAGMERVLIAVQTSKYLSISFEPTGIVFSHMTVVFALDSYSSFAALNASWHTDWIWENCSSLETRLRYIPTDGFETFPMPLNDTTLCAVGQRYDEIRHRLMLDRDLGLTALYNQVHDESCEDRDTGCLRELRVELDRTVAAAYGWSDLDLGHGFHETKHGVRFTISEAARREVLDRLLELNHQRYAEEVARGLHAKGPGKAR